MNEADFIRDICERPGDDLPRLMYADWLEENAGDVRCPVKCFNGWVPRRKELGADYCPTCKGTGRVSDGRMERAEFIRVQCEIAEIQRNARAMRPSNTLPEMAARVSFLSKRERELLGKWSFSFSNEMRNIIGSHAVAHLTTPSPAGIHGHNWVGTVQVQWKFDRGFPVEVRAPLAVLVGGEECERCAGHGDFLDYGLPPWENNVECVACHCTGQTPGIAARLVGVQPVTKWVATDKETRSKGQWYRESEQAEFDPENHPQSNLPDHVFDMLKGGVYLQRPTAWRRYDSPDDALSDLSRAIDTIAREQAGQQKQPAATAG